MAKRCSSTNGLVEINRCDLDKAHPGSHISLAPRADPIVFRYWARITHHQYQSVNGKQSGSGLVSAANNEEKKLISAARRALERRGKR